MEVAKYFVQETASSSQKMASALDGQREWTGLQDPQRWAKTQNEGVWKVAPPETSSKRLAHLHIAGVEAHPSTPNGVDDTVQRTICSSPKKSVEIQRLLPKTLEAIETSRPNIFHLYKGTMENHPQKVCFQYRLPRKTVTGEQEGPFLQGAIQRTVQEAKDR